jgi:16S rRNA (guanine527-N7)-methyltransferase
MPHRIIQTYFPQLSAQQLEQFSKLDALYRDWNAKINVISRKDIDNLYEHHVLHSMAIARMINFQPGTRILDFGTGGGFPGIPLAILFPECQFKLIDGTGKKIRVAQEVAQAIGLTNCHPEHLRGEDERGQYHFVVSRAVMPLPDLVKIVRKNIAKSQLRSALPLGSAKNALPNGIFCLKGGDLQAETQPFRNIVETTDISTFFAEDWYKGKYVIYLPINL